MNNTSTPDESDIKPNLTEIELKNLISKTYGLNGGSFTQLKGYDDLNFHVKPESSINPYIKQLHGYGYVLKVMNSLDSSRPGLCEAQNAVMLFLRKHNIPSPIPVQTIKGEHYTEVLSSGTNSKKHLVRMLEYQHGKVLNEIPKTYSLLYELGQFLAKINTALKEFSHPAYENHTSPWHLKSASEILPQNVVDSPKRKSILENVIQKFENDVLKKSNNFDKGMIHGDFNEHNVLVTKDGNGEWKVSAILDFGDAHYSCYLFELAIALCYMMIECKRQGISYILGGGHFLAGYLSNRPGFSVDFGLIKLCICARLCQSLVLGLKAFKLCPENKYVLDSQEMGWPLLEELWEIPNENLTLEWRRVIQTYGLSS